MKFKLNSRFFLWLLFTYITGYVIYRAGPIFVRGFDLGKLLSSAYFIATGALVTIFAYRSHEAEPKHDEANGNDPDDFAQLRAERDALREEIARLRANKSATPPPVDDWTIHNSRLFKLLPVVIAAAKSEPSWPKQEVLIAGLVDKHGLTQADAKALDAVTRPDELRRK